MYVVKRQLGEQFVISIVCLKLLSFTWNIIRLKVFTHNLMFVFTLFAILPTLYIWDVYLLYFWFGITDYVVAPDIDQWVSSIASFSTEYTQEPG